MQQDLLDPVKKNFISYLDSLNLSAKSHKNYRSDLSHFTSWMILKVRSFGSYVENLTESVPFVSNQIAHEYKNYMTENAVSDKTINRRLSTLRHFSKHLVISQEIAKDFMEGIENVSFAKKKAVDLGPIIEDFRGYLAKEKASKNTIKNYLSDVRQFLTWLEANQVSNSKV